MGNQSINITHFLDRYLNLDISTGGALIILQVGFGFRKLPNTKIGRYPKKGPQIDIEAWEVKETGNLHMTIENGSSKAFFHIDKFLMQGVDSHFYKN